VGTASSAAQLTVPGGDELVAVARDAAPAAAAVLLERYDAAGGPVGLVTKSTATDPVSEADLAAEAAIRDVLARRRPDDGILGEEGTGDVAGTTGLRWIVDPLDGTVNYLFGLPQWCVSVACEGHAGVILDPIRDECFEVVAGEHATLGGEPLRGSTRRDLATALVATGFGYDAEVRAAQADVVARLLPRVRDIRRMGSAALDLAWSAAGRYDAFYERGVKAWDVAAGTMLCAQAGLEVRALPASERLPAGVMVAAPAIAGPLAELVG
jgi:myo-inositol-1(or 4)-monophosphatase